MKKEPTLAALTAICVLCMTAPNYAQEAAKQVKAAERPHENIRLILEVATPGLPTATYTITSNGRETHMENMIEVVDADGSKIQSKMSFDASLMAIKESQYLVTYAYGIQFPVEMSTSTKDGVVSRNIQYSTLGTQSNVTMELGEKMELFSDPQRAVSLVLQRVEPKQESAQN